MYITYDVKANGVTYASLTSSTRRGKAVDKDYQNLGRVIDKEKGIYKNRERGIFAYDLATNTFSPVPVDYIEPKLERKVSVRRRETLVVSFGDIFLLENYIRDSGFSRAVDAIGFRNRDTLHALLSYYILCRCSNRLAGDWWGLTYARLLYPDAQMSSQRISDALKDIGSEEAKRSFFGTYYQLLRGVEGGGNVTQDYDLSDCEGVGEGILIDSTGCPNDIHFPLTAVNTHNGVVSNEIRVIYVVQQKTGLPLFFRYVAGNVIDVSTLKTTIAELKNNGIDTKFAILDAGYYTGKNADALLDANVSFISRLEGNLKVYKKVVAENLDDLEAKENLVRYNGRFVYLKCVPCKIGEHENRDAYAFLGMDLTMKREEMYQLSARADDRNISNEDAFDEMRKHGVFVLIASRKIAKEKVLPLNYTRNQVEVIFDIAKNKGKLLPFNIASEETLRGHLMMTFMAATLLKLMGDKIKGSGLTTDEMFMNLHEQHAIIYDDEILLTEPVKKMNTAYKAFGITCPTTMPLPKNNS